VTAPSLAELDDHPHEVLARLRVDAPVVWVPDLDSWLVTRWVDVERVEADAETFTADLPDSPLSRTIGPNMLHSDGPRHALLRDAIAPVLRPGPLRAWAEQVVPEVAMSLLQALPHGDQVDLVGSYAEPLAVRVLQQLLGLPAQPDQVLRTWFNGIGAGAANFRRDPGVQEIGDAASRAVDEVVTPLLSGAVRADAGTLLSSLVAGELARGEVLGIVKLMIIGGMQEPRDLVGTALAVLATQPEIEAAVRADPGLLPRFLEECLRWNAPVGTATRRATRDVTLAGVGIPAGATVSAALMSANRDEARWRDPHLFRLDREEGSHAAFALGRHSCPGAGLARLLARIAVEAVLEMTPCLGPAVRVEERGFEFRGPSHVGVVWSLV
jgi:cytochrome P450